MARRFIILTALILLALCSAADAAELRLRWAHEGAAEFIVVVYQPLKPEPDSMVLQWRNPEPDADGRFELTLGDIDPDHTIDIHVVAIAADGRASLPSNVLRVTPDEFCGAASCNDLNDCTRDFCDGGGCSYVSTNTPCTGGRRCSLATDTCEPFTSTTTLPPTTTTTTTLATTTTSIVGATSTTTSTSLPLTSTTVLGSITTTTTSTTLPNTLCGNGAVDPGEECDDGDRIWLAGDSCHANCRLVSCGDADGSGVVSVVDALYILSAALNRNDCDPSVCNVDNNAGTITATDALRLLRVVVGMTQELDCPDPDLALPES